MRWEPAPWKCSHFPPMFEKSENSEKNSCFEGERLKNKCNQGSAQVKEEPSGGQRRRPPLEPFCSPVVCRHRI